MMQSAGLAATGVMVLPSAYASLRSMQGKPLPVSYQPLLKLNPILLLAAWASVLGLGYAAAGSRFAWLVIPILHVLAVVIPVLILLQLGLRGLPTGSPQRRWGVFGAGLVLGPLVILIAELAALLAGVVIIVFVVASQPGLIEQLQKMTENLSQFQGDPNAIVDSLLPYLANPTVVILVLVFVALIVPLIEELFKPVGVYLLAGRKITPAAGFAAGALSGAGYAIFESLALNGGGDDWLVVEIARSGTAVIHILTTAMTGWALASAWRDRRFSRLVLTYACVVLVHGMWNGMTVMALVSEAAPPGSQALQWPGLQYFAVLSPVVLVSLTIGAFVVFLWMNWKLRPPVTVPTLE
jgi:RsiW-degrading membrane proteinase PrsW (M82 family)